MCKYDLLCFIDAYLLCLACLFFRQSFCSACNIFTDIFIYIFNGICNIFPNTVVIIIVNYISYVYALLCNQNCNIAYLHFSQLFCIQAAVFSCQIKYKYRFPYGYIIFLCKFSCIYSIFQGLIHDVCLYIILI